MMLRLLQVATVFAVCQAAMAAELSPQIQGNWLGEWKNEGGMGGKTVAEITGLGNGEYQATFTAYDSGEQDKGVFSFSISGYSVNEEKVVFTQKIDLGRLGNFSFDAEVEKGKLDAKYSNGNSFKGTIELQRIEKKVEEVGTKPLPGSVVLLDGKSLEHWVTPDDPAIGWKLENGVLSSPQSDVALPSTEGHLVSKSQFNDAQIHVEFRVPYLPEQRGQARGQGGIYLQGRYELQIVDSFGFPRSKDAADEFSDHDALGAIFQQRAPTEQPALPPGEWQAFDITFLAAKRDAAGKVTRPAEVTVLLNGVQIHDRVPLLKPTEGAPLQDDSTRAGLILQNGGQRVEYRNIWFVPLDAPATNNSPAN